MATFQFKPNMLLHVKWGIKDAENWQPTAPALVTRVTESGFYAKVRIPTDSAGNYWITPPCYFDNNDADLSWKFDKGLEEFTNTNESA